MYFFFASAWAQSPAIGSVKTVRGEATITTAGKPVKATLGTPVFAGSQLTTASNSSLGLVFNDATVMSFGADTTVTIDDYLYAPSNGQNKFATKLVKGSLGYLSGAIAKLKPDAVSIQTRSGTLGVRGTKVLLMDSATQSLATLVADPDGNTGQAVVRGTRGTQFLTETNTSVPLDGSTPPSGIDQNVLQQTFQDVFNAFPPQPPLPAMGQGFGTGTGAGAQPSIAAAVGGTGAGLVTLGLVAATLAVEGLKGSTGTTGTR